MEERQEQIHEKGFDMTTFNKIRIDNARSLEDISYNISAIRQANLKYTTKLEVLRALRDKDYKRLREISEFFYRTNGIYFRVCNYFAEMYRYDWYLSLQVKDKKILQDSRKDKMISDFNETLEFLDNSQIKKTCTRIALTAIKSGVYYGFLVDSDNCIMLQDLPPEYCRTRYNIGNNPLIELNMQAFDNLFPNPTYRVKVLKTFPKDVQTGYIMYKQGKLTNEYGGASTWYPLEPGTAFKFDFGNDNLPLFASAIPSIFDLEAAQDLDRRKQMQDLLKILVQKLPRDKNNDLIFDVDEAADIHRNAVEMLSNAIGVDVITTFADIEAINIADKNTATTKDDLEKMERGLYNSFGIPQNIFNASGNIALANSILNDESLCFTLLYQLESFYNNAIQKRNKKKYGFKLNFLNTTQYNYKDIAKLYKEQSSMGFSKMLPQIALGQSQSFIINSCTLENEILGIQQIMIPPALSSTTSGTELLGKNNESSASKNQSLMEEEKTPGRPEKDETEKSDKTLANEQAM